MSSTTSPSCGASVCLALILAQACATASGPGQSADLDFRPPIASPVFDVGAGPLVLVDEAHHNFHTAQGRYRPFAELLRRDGYVVRPSTETFTERSLAGAQILVISNALNVDDAEEWVLPNPPAFTRAEVATIGAWVERGGSLMLIADHMPFPGAAAELAESFGLLFVNGYALADSGRRGRITFTRAEGTLGDHPVTNGRSASERIDAVTTFTGQAFRPRPGAQVEEILIMGEDVDVLLPTRASTFSETTPRVPADGWLQGAVLRHGVGRVAVFGEAAMFSAQVSGQQRFPMGMNDPDAGQNFQFLLNVVHWLSGELE